MGGGGVKWRRAPGAGTRATTAIVAHHAEGVQGSFNEHRWCFVSAGRPIYPLVLSFSVIAGRLIDILSNGATKGGGRRPRYGAGPVSAGPD